MRSKVFSSLVLLLALAVSGSLPAQDKPAGSEQAWHGG